VLGIIINAKIHNDLVSALTRLYEMERQMEVQQGGGRAGTGGGAFSSKAFSQAALGLRPVVRQTVAFWRCTSRSSTRWAAA
jgi:hypothetical protein